MSYSQHDLSEAEHADVAHAHGKRNDERLANFKHYIAGAFQQWIERDEITLDDPIWKGFAKRSQESLQTMFLGRLNDACDEIGPDYLGTDQ